VISLHLHLIRPGFAPGLHLIDTLAISLHSHPICTWFTPGLHLIDVVGFLGGVSSSAHWSFALHLIRTGLHLLPMVNMFGVVVSFSACWSFASAPAHT
jgi:hypothetical protein